MIRILGFRVSYISAARIGISEFRVPRALGFFKGLGFRASYISAARIGILGFRVPRV
jgi:hypothetical protein